MDRRIAHLDMDAFYASVELLRFPQLKGLPVVIGGRRRRESDNWQKPEDFHRLRDYVGRGVVTTSTYPARELGVFSGMGLMKSAALAPDAILLPADFDQYRKYSRLFKAAVLATTELVEDRGIDEIYIDLTDVPGETVELAQRIKDDVREATGLTCSIGVTPNKLLSKIASDLNKPDGLTVLTMAAIPAVIWPLPARKINGIGPKASEKLAALGINTIGELAAADPTFLIEHFGKHYGAWMAEAAQGHDERPVVTEQEPKSISRETTFERDLDVKRDRAELTKTLSELCEWLSNDLKRKGYLGKTIGIKLRFEDFKIVTRDLTLTEPTADMEGIRAAARECLKRVTFDRRMRLLGVRAGVLVRRDELQSSPDKVSEPEPHGYVDHTLPLFQT